MPDNSSAEIKHQKLHRVNELPFPFHLLLQLLLDTQYFFLTASFIILCVVE